MIPLDRSAPGVRIRVLPSERARTGEPLDVRGRLLSFSFEDSTSKADKASLELDNHDLALFDRAELGAGTLWEVSWGYPGAMAPPRRLVVKKVRGFLSLTVEAVSLGILLHHEAKARTFRDRTPGELAAEIAREYGYEGPFLDVDVSGERLPLVTQAGETDARLLRRLAARMGWTFRIDAEGFHFHPRRPEVERGRVLVWHNDPGRGDVISINVESNLARRIDRAVVRGRDPMKKATVSEEAKAEATAAPTGPEEVVSRETGRSGRPLPAPSPAPAATVQEIRDPVTGQKSIKLTKNIAAAPATTAAKAKAQAKARVASAAGEVLKLSVEVVGDPTLRVAELLELRGAGKRLSGKYRVRRATHRLSSQSYVCSLEMRRTAETAAAAAAGRRSTAAASTGDAAKPREPGALYAIDLQDRETGREVTVYRREGEPLGASDPEGHTR